MTNPRCIRTCDVCGVLGNLYYIESQQSASMTDELLQHDVGLFVTRPGVIYWTLSSHHIVGTVIPHLYDTARTANFATCTQHNAICRKFTQTSAGLHLGVSTDLSSLVSISCNTAIIDYLPSLSRAACVMHRSSAANTIIRRGDRQ